MATPKLPLLHKYVFHHDDDLDLKMSKLQYRLCVQEVSNVILGKQHNMDLSDLEPTISPDLSMATTVEAHPPRMEDFPGRTTEDEGLSSPESEDYPHKGNAQSNNPDYIYNDSGILMDESSLNNTAVTDINGHHHYDDDDDDDDDQLSDVSSNDPNDYHISRNDDQDYDINDDDNGDDQTQNGLTEVDEEIITATERQKESHQQFDNLPPRVDGDSPIAEDEDNMSADLQPTVSDAAPQPDEYDDVSEVNEEVILRSEAKRDDLESSREEEIEEEREDFVTGTTCDDVETALRILKTRYRLSCSTLKKCVITSPQVLEARNKRYSVPIFMYERSKWNLQDMIRGPNEQMPWWSQSREPAKEAEEKDDRGVINDTIDRRQTEIADLLEKVLDEERKKQAEAEKNNPTVVSEPAVIPVSQEPALEAIPEDEAEPKIAEDDADEPSGKKKKGNLFQRMVRALRKRLSRNHRHRA